MTWVSLVAQKQIIIMGVGNILFTDEGVGVRVAEALNQQYEFPENVRIVDGGVLGMNLLGTISQADVLIVVDAVRNGQPPGTLYRLEGEDIPKRVLAKNSLHQVDLLEALTFCQALDKSPETVIIGIEPEDIKTVGLEMTATVRNKLSAMVEMVIIELGHMGIGSLHTKTDTQKALNNRDGDETPGIPKI